MRHGPPEGRSDALDMRQRRQKPLRTAASHAGPAGERWAGGSGGTNRSELRHVKKGDVPVRDAEAAAAAETHDYLN
jgi:hypothetical protein